MKRGPILYLSTGWIKIESNTEICDVSCAGCQDHWRRHGNQPRQAQGQVCMRLFWTWAWACVCINSLLTLRLSVCFEGTIHQNCFRIFVRSKLQFMYLHTLMCTGTIWPEQERHHSACKESAWTCQVLKKTLPRQVQPQRYSSCSCFNARAYVHTCI